MQGKLPTMTVLLVLLLSGSLACSNFISDQRTRDRQSNIDRAMRDDARCQEKGHEYPSPAYTRCRQSLQDQRERRQVFSLELIDPQDDYMMDPNDPRRRLTSERGDFRCEERQWEETRWIQCRTWPREDETRY